MEDGGYSWVAIWEAISGGQMTDIHAGMTSFLNIFCVIHKTSFCEYLL